MKHFLIFLLCLLQNCCSFLKPTFHHLSSKTSPKYMTSETDSSSTLPSTFRDFELPSWLVERCEELGFSTPTEVQRLGLPLILDGNDVILQAQTGSGKTLVFALPVLAMVDPSRAAIQAVVVVPTRELGLQVASTLKQLGKGSPEKISVMTVVEGSQNRRQQLWATAEPPHIVVGNPRALQRIVEMGRLRLNSVSVVVIDEVDACLLGHETKQDLHTLLSRRLSSSYQSAETISEDEATSRLTENRVFSDHTKHARQETLERGYRGRRQTVFCSATIPQRKHFVQTCVKNGWTQSEATLVLATPEQLTPSQVRHEEVVWSSDDSSATSESESNGAGTSDEDFAELGQDREDEVKVALLKYILKAEMAVREKEGTSDGDASYQTMVFTESPAHAFMLCSRLQAALSRLYSNSGNSSSVNKEDLVCVLSDDMNIDSRGEALDIFRQGVCRVLVSTDLAARGIDVPDTSLVVQWRLPSTVEQYVHRAGRTGRAGRSGKVITFTSNQQAFVVRRYANEMGMVDIKRRVIKVTPKSRQSETQP